MSLPNLPFRLFIVCEYVDPARLAPASYVFCAACDTVFAVFCAACDTVFAPLDTVFAPPSSRSNRLFRLLSPLLKPRARASRARRAGIAPSAVRPRRPSSRRRRRTSRTSPRASASARSTRARASRVVRIVARRPNRGDAARVRIAATRRAVRRGARRARAWSHGERCGRAFHAIRARRGASARERVRRARENWTGVYAGCWRGDRKSELYLTTQLSRGTRIIQPCNGGSS